MASGFKIISCVLAFALVLNLLSGGGVSGLFADMKQVVGYFFLVVFSDLLSFAINHKGLDGIGIGDFNILLMARVLTLVSLASLLFRTTGFYDVWKSADSIECFVFRKRRRQFGTLSKTAVMFVSFVPGIFKAWETLARSYSSRGGRAGVRMVADLMPILIRNCLAKADRLNDAIKARE